MRLSRISIKNFRNFEHLDIVLGPNVVVVGENKIGKSNLLFALRLLLDPTLADSARQLRVDDFWDGLRPVDAKGQRAPLPAGAEIEISAEISDFADEKEHFAVLGEYLVETEPLVARLTYVFRARADLDRPPSKDSDYEFLVYGGKKEENFIGFELRKRIPLDVLPALRDAEGDMANWRKSPLRPLLEKVSSELDEDDLNAIAGKVSAAANAVGGLDGLKKLEDAISERVKEMVGPGHGNEVKLAVAATGPDKLVRALRPFIDEGRRSLNEASLGSANLIYLALKSVELRHLVEDDDREHTFLAIEEPEAHLHPHLQRLIYRDLLATRQSEKKERARPAATSVILTTHSPHIVSVSPLRSLVLLKHSADGKSTVGASVAPLPLDEAQVEDLERYLDVTRGEMLFSRGVILVEGDAEEFLVPAFAQLHGIDLDALGITVCSVSGTNFLPYALLLGPQGLDLPFAVLTDLDPKVDGRKLGESRVVDLLAAVHPAYAADKTAAVLLARTRKCGFFLNDHTLEIDVFKCGQQQAICDTLIELTENGEAKERAKAWKKEPDTLDAVRFLKDIAPIGKGRFAQRLASKLVEPPCPAYILDGLKYVADRNE